MKTVVQRMKMKREETNADARASFRFKTGADLSCDNCE